MPVERLLPGARKQAMVPEGSHVLSPAGTAPGVIVPGGVTLPPSGAPFYIQVESEVEKVTAWTGSGPYTLTTTRAQLGTSAARHASGTVYMPGGSASGGTYALKITSTGNVDGTVKYETVADARPGAKSEIASSKFVLPAPFSPVNAIMRAPRSRSSVA